MTLCPSAVYGRLRPHFPCETGEAMPIPSVLKVWAKVGTERNVKANIATNAFLLVFEYMVLVLID